MTTPSSFLKIGSYLPSVVLVATALIFGGLREWVSAGWVELEDEHQSPGHGKAADIGETPKTWVPRRRNLLDAFVVIAASHLIGLILFLIICQGWSGSHRLSVIIPLVCWITLVLAPWESPSPSRSVQAAPLHIILKAINMCLASTLISVSSVLNFSLAALLAVTLGVPLSLASPSDSLLARGIKCALYTTLAFGWLAFDAEVKQGVWDWEVLGAWFTPLVCVVYVPFVLQAGIVSSLSP